MFLCTQTKQEHVEFKEHQGGLYYHDAMSESKGKQRKQAISMPVKAAQTVTDNKRHFTNQQVKDAENTQRLYSMVGRPSTTDYKGLVGAGLLRNCPVKVEDITNADKIYGPSVAALKGKTTIPKTPVVRQDIIAIPPIIRNHHNQVDVVADLMFVNQVPFLVTLSRTIAFGSSQFLRRRTGINLLKGIKN